jgi:hypothetical protein
MNQPFSIKVGCFFFNCLIPLYPAPFRQEYGEEMRAFFIEASEDAHRARGVGGLFRLWLATLADFLVASSREHLAAGTLKALLVVICAASAGLLIGYLDFHAGEVQPIVALELVCAFLLGLMMPVGPWKWVLCVGGGIPAVHVVGQWLGLHPAYPVMPNVSATFLALIPAAIGAYAGAGIRALAKSVQRLA